MNNIKTDLPFKKLGKYDIISILGRGAMGMVYKGYDPGLKRYVAIKTVGSDLLNREFPENKSSIQRFENEAESAARLNHPNIVAIYENGDDENVFYIVMEFVNGQELKEAFDKKRRFNKMSQILKLMTQLLDALSHSHEKGVVHRDIKPANIIVTPSGDIKLADFGVARIESSNITQIGTIIGTPSYMSPEMLSEQAIDKRTDLFSAGIVFYQLLTGEKPFVGETLRTVMHRILNEDHIPPSILNPTLPDGLDNIIDKALAKNPNKRYQSASEFSDDIKKIIHPAEKSHPSHFGSSGMETSNVLPKRDHQLGKTQSLNPTDLISYGKAHGLLGNSGIRKNKKFKTAAIAISVFVIVVTAAISYFYLMKPSAETIDIKSSPDPSTMPFEVPSRPGEEPLIKTDIAQGESPPDPEKEEVLFELRSQEDREKQFLNTFSNFSGKADISDVRSWLKLTAAFMDKTMDESDLSNFIKGKIMRLDYLSLVTEGSTDILCIMSKSEDGFNIEIKSSYFVVDEDEYPTISVRDNNRQKLTEDINLAMTKLFSFNAFALLEIMNPASKQSSPRLNIKGS